MRQQTIFFHGWSYTPNFWNSYVQKHKTSFNAENHAVFYDRGYISPPCKPPLIDGFNRCVTHSMGLFFAAIDYNLSVFDEIIIYAGFTRFPNQVAAKVMRLKLNKYPDKVIADFQSACGYAPSLAYSLYNRERLCDDLQLLEHYDLATYKKWPVSYTAYHGTHDPIVSRPLDNAIILQHSDHLCNLV